jgi:hypothetical protein
MKSLSANRFESLSDLARSASRSPAGSDGRSWPSSA